jgi:hypothetical protein
MPETGGLELVRHLGADALPLVLDYEVPGDGFRLRYTKISYPTGGANRYHVDPARLTSAGLGALQQKEATARSSRPSSPVRRRRR